MFMMFRKEGIQHTSLYHSSLGVPFPLSKVFIVRTLIIQTRYRPIYVEKFMASSKSGNREGKF